MSVDAVSSATSIYEQYFGTSETSATNKTLTVEQKLEKERLEVEQLEFLARRLGKLSGLFEKLREDWRREECMSASRSRDLAETVRDIFTVVNEVHTYHVPGFEPASFLESARDGLVTALKSSVTGDVLEIADELGLVLDPDLDDDETRTGKLLPDGRGLEKDLSRLIRNRYRDGKELLFGSHGVGGGIIPMLELRINASLKSLHSTAESRGLSLDAYA